MTENELEELRYDAAHHQLSKMSEGSQFQYALDRMLQLMSHYGEEDLKEMLPGSKKKKDTPNPCIRSKGGTGF